MARFTFFHTQGDLNDPPGTTYTQVPGTVNDLPGIAGGGTLTVISSMYIAGALQLPFGDISGHTQMTNGTGFVGDSASDVLWMNSGSTHNVIIWDDRTTNRPDVVNPSGRYGLPGGSVGQETISIEVIRGGDVDVAGSASDVISDDFINLSYNAADGGRAYELAITIYGGTGRDLIVAGEGNDVIYGGNEDDNLGDGLLGMGGNDTIYGGRNNTSTGADDLFGYAGNDSLFAANDGDVMYGDDGNDALYSAGYLATDPDGRAINSANNVTLFGGNGDDIMYASRLPGGVGASNGREFFFGGTPDTDWDDEEYFPNNNGTDDSLNDTVSYTNTQAAVTVDLSTTFDDTANLGDMFNPHDPTGALLNYSTGAGGAVNDRLYGIEHLVGTAFNDLLIGSAVNNRLEGGVGIDTLQGLGGSDTLIGGAGDDTIDAGADNDLVEGGVGADSLAGGTGSDTLSYAQSGAGVTVTLNSGPNPGSGGDAQGDTVAGDFENLLGSAFNDTLVGDGNVNAIFGSGGDDLIRGGAGGDSLYGGTGIDTLSYAGSAAVRVTLGGGGTGGDAQGDVLADDFEHLLGSSNDDLLRGRASLSTTIVGGQGNDTVEGGSVADSLDGGAGAGDFLSYEHSSAGVNVTLAGNIVANGDAAGDVIGNFENLIGSAHDDGLTGDGGTNTIFGGAGNDAVDGLGGNDTLYGGDGSDFAIYGNSGASVVVDLGQNTATGGLGNDRLFEIENVSGSNFDDTITGDGNANTLWGGLGVDTIEGGLGDDVMAGVDQSDPDAPTDGDWLSYNSAGAGGVQVSLFAGTASGAAGNDIFGGFRHLRGSELGSDFLEGDDENNTILGLGGDDTLSGLASIDTVYGGAGNDTILAGTNGGTFDTTVVGGWDGEAGSGPINVTLDLGTERVSDLMFGGDTLGVDTGIDTVDMAQLIGDSPRTLLNSPNSNFGSFLAGIEIIVAGAAADVINLTFNDGVTRAGYASNISIFSGDGADIVFSGSGNDVVVGGRRIGIGDGDGTKGDQLYGGAGNDTIFGDDFDTLSPTVGNADLLYGGSGNDSILGGGGGDTIYGGSGTDQLNGGYGDDYIYDEDASDLAGDVGADILVINSASGASNYNVSGGKDELTSDGADRAFAGGVYGTINASMGADNDIYISTNADVGSPLGQIDRVFGEGQDDVLSTWYGNDRLFGGDGNDALWGGAGVDTIFGDNDDDIIYGGAGDDLLIGGDGDDYYYFARTDGRDLISDQDPTSPDANNYLVVIPDFDPATDDMRVGSGVFETDHDLYDNVGGDDMVQVENIGGSMHRLTILSGPGAGSAVEFDANEVSVIGLWNNDATGGTPVITAYYWDPIDGRYEYQP